MGKSSQDPRPSGRGEMAQKLLSGSRRATEGHARSNVQMVLGARNFGTHTKNTGDVSRGKHQLTGKEDRGRKTETGANSNQLWLASPREEASPR